MKHTVEEAARIEREKILQELKDGYSKHKDTSLYNAFAATIEKYAVPLEDFVDHVNKHGNMSESAYGHLACI